MLPHVLSGYCFPLAVLSCLATGFIQTELNRIGWKFSQADLQQIDEGPEKQGV